MAWHQYQALSSTGMDFISSLWLRTGDSTVVEHSPNNPKVWPSTLQVPLADAEKWQEKVRRLWNAMA